jgi:phosphatidate cytidylyltransferase
MTRRIVAAAVLIPVVILSAFHLPLVVFLILVDLVLILAVLELFSILSHLRVEPYWITFPFLLALPWVWNYRPDLLTVYLTFSVLTLLCWCVYQTREMKHGFPSVSGNLLAYLYLGIPFSVISVFQGARALEMVLVLVVVWAQDTAGYFVGRAWGKRKVTPRISPNKSLEGYIAGMTASVAVALPFGAYLFSWPIIELVVLGILLGATGILGDLFESVLKRGAGVKDSSNLIPGHGGVLDRLDSLLFAFPAYYLFANLVE